MEISELYRALEFSRCAERYRDKVIAIGLSRNTPFRDLVLDFKVLAAHGAKVVITAADPNFELQREIALSNAHGSNFCLIQATEPREVGSYELSVNIAQVQSALDAGQMPVIVYHCLTEQTSRIEAAQELGKSTALKLNAQKIIFVSQAGRAMQEKMPSKRVLHDEIDAFCKQLDELNFGHFEPSVRFVEGLLQDGVPDIAFLAGMPGQICQEILTLEGAGLLFSRVARSHVRQAELSDISDIAFQIRPQVEAGRILPVSENEIAQNIRNFWVYEIDGQIVSLLRLKLYGDWAEIATGSTVFRDRGYGRLSQLFAHVLTEAKRREIAVIFGVGISPKMEASLIPLGFEEKTHDELPQAWQDQYDKTRPSRAFALRLS